MEDNRNLNVAKLFDELPRVMDHFDWDMTYALYKVLKWDWGGAEITTDSLKSTANMLLRNAIASYEKTGKTSMASTGGLIANVFVWDNSVELHLTFAPVHWWHNIPSTDS